MKLESFKDLKVWQEGNLLVLEVYKFTKSFPIQEQFGLTNQMRRAAVSITSNIAEGFVRRGIREKSQFYYMSLGSLAELQSQLIISSELKYLSTDDHNNVQGQCNLVGKLLNGLIKSTNQR